MLWCSCAIVILCYCDIVLYALGTRVGRRELQREVLLIQEEHPAPLFGVYANTGDHHARAGSADGDYSVGVVRVDMLEEFCA